MSSLVELLKPRSRSVKTNRHWPPVWGFHKTTLWPQLLLLAQISVDQ